jgi:hypothetical protein
VLYLVSFLALAAIPLALGGYGAHLAAQVIDDKKHRRNAMLTVWGLAALGVLFAGVQQFLVYRSDNVHDAKLEASSLQQENMRGQLQSIGLMIGALDKNGNNPDMREVAAAIERAAKTASNRNLQRPSHSFLVAPHDAGTFTAKHGAGCKPSDVAITMTAGGNMWLQAPKSWDETNVYLVASGEGLSARVMVWCEQ